MSQVIAAYYQNWESELTLLRTDDLLVNIDYNKVLTSLEALWDQTAQRKQILADYRKIKREQGIDALVYTQGLVHWQKGTKFIQTPVFLYEATKIQLEQKKIEFSEQAQLNPYIKLYLENEWGIETPAFPDKDWILTLVERGIFSQYDAISLLGNFHPQRYELRREWEALKNQTEFSPALLQVLGDFDQEPAQKEARAVNVQISLLDPDQKAAIEVALTNSCVIYGPPGTGKSAVLSNFIAQVILEQKKALVVSEKRGALEVIKQRLTAAGLGQYCLLAPTKNELANFYQQLQLDFQALLQANFPKEKFQLNHKNEARQYWQQRKELESSTNLSFEALSACFGPKKKSLKTQATERWKLWLDTRQFQNALPKEILPSLRFLNAQWMFKPKYELEYQWLEWQELKNQLGAIFQLESVNDIDELARKSRICQQFQTQVFQKYIPLFSAQQEKILKLLNAYLYKEKQLRFLETKLSAWLQIPSKAEWPILKSLSSRTGFFQKRKWRKVAKTWLRLPNIAIEPFEKEIQQYWQLHLQLQQHALKLDQIGIEDLDTEVPMLKQLLKQINWEHFKWYLALSQDEQAMYAHYQTQAYRLASVHRALFNDQNFNLSILHSEISIVWNLLEDHISTLQKIPHEIWLSIGQDIACSEELKEEFWAYLRAYYPLLYQWDTPTWKAELDQAEKYEQDQLSEYQNEVQKRQIEQFNALEYLLTCPLKKLTATQKDTRVQLRKGKSILIKEMAKTRQFSSLKNLLEGPAAPWLLAIYPVWLLNPSIVANSLPMRASIFNFGLFDEASQLPLSHAIGALQRVENVLVAGDPEQMRPSSYFSAKTEGVIDLLHQAAFHLPRRLLRYHYRSEHPSLITFSNKHFYQNELKTWPSTQSVKQAVFQHYVAQGVYLDRKNEQEAKVLANELKKHLYQEDKVGVVAFSNQQLQCIYNYLNVAEQELLEEKINERQAFFLALEQVQGEECDHLLISFGFGKNQAGEFNLRFGPMNQTQGSKRLNVLLTRARKSLHFYCSVKAADFPRKRSESVELIYQWFLFLESPIEHTATYDANERLTSADDFDSFLHCYRVLRQRSALPDRV